MCSRVKHNNFFEYNAFLCVKVSHMDGYLGLRWHETVDFDVFLSQPGYFPYAFCESYDRKCNQHQVFSYAHDMFAAFFSFLVRLYLNIAMKCFETLLSNISLAEEKKLIAKIVTEAKMLLFRFFDLNYEFFYEFFDLFSKVNGSDCYLMFSNKPKYGPYSCLKYNLQIIMF